jgi:hypothetical protein
MPEKNTHTVTLKTHCDFIQAFISLLSEAKALRMYKYIRMLSKQAQPHISDQLTLLTLGRLL